VQKLNAVSKKVIITGGAGFIGSNLAEALAEESEVVIVDDLSSGKRENLLGIDARLIEGSITDLTLLKDAFDGADCIFHLGAIASVQRSVEDPLLVNEVNLNGTLNVLTAARDTGVRRMVFASTAAVYGASPMLPKKEDMLQDPRSPYAVAKLAGEHYASVFQDLYGLEAVALRFFNVFGPRQDPTSEYSGVISRFISAVLKGEQPVIYGDGEQTRDFVFVKDVVRACILASESSATGVFNIARGESISLNQLLSLLGRIAGREVVPRYGEPRAGDIRHSLADIGKAEMIGYRPRYAVEEGLRRTVEWLSGI
jgi:nucleoside-diphosphate-sugar epimerase